jgi:hypothetical protein
VHDYRRRTRATRPRKAEHERQERHREDVEADVGAEGRVADAEGRAVLEEQPVLPLRGGAHAGEQAEDDRYADRGDAAQRVERHPVALEAGLLRRHQPEDRPHAVGDPHVDADDERHREAKPSMSFDAGRDRRQDLGGSTDWYQVG